MNDNVVARPCWTVLTKKAEDRIALIQKRSATPKIDRGKSLKIVSIFSQQKDYPINKLPIMSKTLPLVNA